MISHELEPLRPRRYERGGESVQDDGAAPPLPRSRPEAPATPQAARRQLALSLEREPALRANASAALAYEVMRGILTGEWAIADHFESEQRRFVIVRRCREGDGRALSEREREVLALAVQGHSNKAIAYELVLTPSTVATHLRRIMTKLRIESREALIQVLPHQWGEEDES